MIVNAIMVALVRLNAKRDVFPGARLFQNNTDDLPLNMTPNLYCRTMRSTTAIILRSMEAYVYQKEEEENILLWMRQRDKRQRDLLAEILVQSLNISS